MAMEKEKEIMPQWGTKCLNVHELFSIISTASHPPGHFSFTVILLQLQIISILL